ncbi:MULTISPECIES: hypothetical protein [Sphingomonas]|uniref:hypothetical protein n=1 Tax=Sphingomonas TaxID=13687 RepID=UPI000830BD0E|nr:hypothetical protein [Sphingomonas sp. CCH10-B3]
MKAAMAIALAFALAGCDSIQRAVSSATGEAPAATCASSSTYRAINQVILDRIWPPDMPRSRRIAYSDIDEMMRTVKFEQPVLEAVDATTGSVKCSAQLVLRSTPLLQFGEFPVDLHVKALRDRLVLPITYEIVRTADDAKRIVRLANEDAIADFVLRYGKAAEIGRDTAPVVDRDAIADDATPSPVINEQEAPIDTRDEQLGDNHL